MSNPRELVRLYLILRDISDLELKLRVEEVQVKGGVEFHVDGHLANVVCLVMEFEAGYILKN